MEKQKRDEYDECDAVKERYNQIKQKVNNSEYSRIARLKRFMDEDLDKFLMTKTSRIEKDPDLSRTSLQYQDLKDNLRFLSSVSRLNEDDLLNFIKEIEKMQDSHLLNQFRSAQYASLVEEIKHFGK